MNYIVLDLEWNQGTADNVLNQMPVEIIEIGAVKLDEQLRIVNRFEVLIKPQVYPDLSAELMHMMRIDLETLRKDGIGFDSAIRKFFKWCGTEPYCFCTWGNMDLTELQRNMRYYRIKPPFAQPVYYCDVQKCFGLQYKKEDAPSALDKAVKQLAIPCERPFHRALSDADYTALVMGKLDRQLVKRYYSVDYYKNPKNKREELHLQYPDFHMFVSREFSDRQAMMKDREILSTRCYVCARNLRRRINWYSSNGRCYYCLAKCPEHGFLVGRIRLKKTDAGKVFADKILKLGSKADAERVRMRRDEIRRKRKERKRAKEKGQNVKG